MTPGWGSSLIDFTSSRTRGQTVSARQNARPVKKNGESLKRRDIFDV
jgi:hypothetical protein